MADFVGAVDQGTTSTRFMIFDHSGNEVGIHQLERAEQMRLRRGQGARPPRGEAGDSGGIGLPPARQERAHRPAERALACPHQQMEVVR